MKRGRAIGILVLGALCGLYQPSFAENGQDGSVRSYFPVRQGEAAPQFQFRTIEQDLADKGKAVVTLEFDFGQAALKPAHLPFIDMVTKTLRAHTDWHLSIEGHTDSTGNAANNKRLSLLRAETIRDALIAKGIAAERLTCVGQGQEKPLVPNDSTENRAANRRVELIRTDAAGAKS